MKKRFPTKSAAFWTVLTLMGAVAFTGRLSRGSLKAHSFSNDVGEVERTDLAQQVTVAGSILPFRRTMIAPPYSAYVHKLFVKLGQQIKPGDPIVTLVQSLRGAQENKHPLRAPFPGTVVQVLHTEGEQVDPAKEGSGIVRIDDLNTLYNESNVPESDIGKISKGQNVVVRVNPILDRPYHGVIESIALAAVEKKDWRNADRVEFEVKIRLTDPDARVRPGMSTIVDIITAKRDNVLTLPHEFIEKRRDKYYATLASGERREIHVGLQGEDRFEIVSGLQENDRVKKVDFTSLPVED